METKHHEETLYNQGNGTLKQPTKQFEQCLKYELQLFQKEYILKCDLFFQKKQ
jgi:hypothetical protein